MKTNRYYYPTQAMIVVEVVLWSSLALIVGFALGVVYLALTGHLP